MIASSPISDFSIADFTSGSLYLVATSAGGSIAGGSSNGYEKTRVAVPTAGAVGGGAFVWTYGVLTAGGYPMYGDLCYGDMPYLLRQSESVGGAVAGSANDDDAVYSRLWVKAADGGALVGGLAEYFRLWNKEPEGGALAGGWALLDGDFSKTMRVLFGFKAPRVIFVMSADKSDIEDLVERYK